MMQLKEKKQEQQENAYRELEKYFYGACTDESEKRVRIVRDVMEKNNQELLVENGIFAVVTEDIKTIMCPEDIIAVAGSMMYRETMNAKQKAMDTYELDLFTREYKDYLESVEKLHAIESLYAENCFFNRKEQIGMKGR